MFNTVMITLEFETLDELQVRLLGIATYVDYPVVQEHDDGESCYLSFEMNVMHLEKLGIDLAKEYSPNLT